ncbi:MAG: hypothetical protein Q7J10_10225, partial [Methanosarcinaceae archaeon]|nr:hypothetical protein [Methanosarcinaceae archaeon]
VNMDSFFTAENAEDAEELALATLRSLRPLRLIYYIELLVSDRIYRMGQFPLHNIDAYRTCPHKFCTDPGSRKS